MKPGNSFVYYLLPGRHHSILVYIVFTETQASFLQDKRAKHIQCDAGHNFASWNIAMRRVFGFQIIEISAAQHPGMNYLKTQSYLMISCLYSTAELYLSI
jgi:hypothetical protein